MDELTEFSGPESPSERPGDSAAAPRRWHSLAPYALGAALVLFSLAVAFAITAAVAATGQRTSVTSDATSTPAATSTPQPQTASIWDRPAVSASGLADASGVRIAQVALTGGGGLIDLRFQVLNEQKAAAIHDAGHPPALVQAATGVVVNSLLMGHSHSDPFHAGQTYYLIFENPGNLVQPGDKVSVLLGDAEVDDIAIK